MCCRCSAGTFAEAARTGNPDAALAFNPGQIPWLPSLSAHQDFTSGEIGNEAQFPRRMVGGEHRPRLVLAEKSRWEVVKT